MEETKPTVPITPMLDLTFQLLFFFITLFDPSAGGKRMIEGQMDMALPATKKDKKVAANPNNIDPKKESEKDDPELDIPTDLTVVVRTQMDGSNNGGISDLAIEDRAGTNRVEYDR